MTPGRVSLRNLSDGRVEILAEGPQDESFHSLWKIYDVGVERSNSEVPQQNSMVQNINDIPSLKLTGIVLEMVGKGDDPASLWGV